MQKPIKIIANWKSILIIFIILLCIQTPSFAVTEVTLQWDHSIDKPYLADYKVYYGTASGDYEPNEGDRASHYSIDDGATWNPISSDPPISVGTADITKIQIKGLTDTKVYYFVVTSYDTRGLESNYSNEVATLKIDSISPDAGHIDGDQAVTITGGGFEDGTTVTIGGVEAISVAFVSTNQITCTTPAHAEGMVDVVVTNPDAKTATLTNGYEFVSFTLGDVNNDGKITPADASAAFQLYLTKEWENMTGLEKCTADFNHSNSVTPADASAIFQEYLDQ